MNSDRTNSHDPQVIALQALAATLSDQRRADRLLATTGLDAESLRDRASEPELLGAVLDFLAAHEPDLLAVADAIAVPPAALVAARGQLAR